MKVLITLGQNHAHRINNITFDKDSIILIRADSERQAREWMEKHCDNQFFTSYTEKRFEPELLKFFPRGIIDSGLDLRTGKNKNG